MSSQNFTVMEKLSESSTTAVYKAFQVALKRTVLLKILHKHLANDPELKARFTREALACASLRSQHIVQVYDLTEIDGAPAIVMEYIDGQSLKQRLSEGKPESFDFVKKVAIEVLEGLLIAHENGVIHRDLKPGNILISKDNIVKITDFGLASISSATSITVEGVVLGTPAYMSPEQVRGETLDARSDLFSLGVTLIELLTGERIFDGASYAECIKKISNFKLDLLSDLHLDVPPSFLQFINRLMEPNTGKRFSSAREALESLGYKKDENKPAIKAHKRKFIKEIVTSLIILIVAVIVIVFQSNKKSEPRESSIVDTSSTNAQIQKSTISTSNNVPEQPIQSGTIKQEQVPTVQDSIHFIGSSQIADSGYLMISAKPWAKVYINNQYIGDTPLSNAIKVKAGTHTIVFNYRMFGPIVKSATVKGNLTTTVEANFLENAGYVTLQVIPWAYIYIDDQYYDVTPLSTPMILPAGKRTLRLHNPKYEDITKEVIVNANDTLRLSLSYLHKDSDAKK